MPALDLIRPSVTAMRVIASVNDGFVADIFMPHDHRNRDGFLRPVIPVIDVNVSTADGCFTDFNQ